MKTLNFYKASMRGEEISELSDDIRNTLGLWFTSPVEDPPLMQGGMSCATGVVTLYCYEEGDPAAEVAMSQMTPEQEQSLVDYFYEHGFTN